MSTNKNCYEWRYDVIAQAGYLKCKKGKIDRTLELTPNLFIDVNEDGEVLGVEYLHRSTVSRNRLENDLLKALVDLPLHIQPDDQIFIGLGDAETAVIKTLNNRKILK